MNPDHCDLLCLDLPRAEAVRAMVPAAAVAIQAAAVARAFGDPTRLRVAAALAAGGELCVCDVAWICDVSRNLASHHVRQLLHAGVAASRREGRLVMYWLTAQGRVWLATITAPAGSPHADTVSEVVSHG